MAGGLALNEVGGCVGICRGGEYREENNAVMNTNLNTGFH